MRLALRLAVLAATLLLLPASARADLSGLVWEQQAVRYPVEPSKIRLPMETGKDGRLKQVEARGPIRLEPGKAAVFRLGSMRFSRVRLLSGQNTSAVRFHRIVGGATEAAQSSTVLVQEHPERVDETSWYLVQPPPDDNLWLISATEPVTVAIERPYQRPARLAWTVARDRLFGWITGGGAMPGVPDADGTSLMRLRLRGEEVLAQAAGVYFGESSGMKAAMRHWRKASADLALLGVRRLVRPFLFERDLMDEKAPGFGQKEFVYRGNKKTKHSPVAYRRYSRDSASWLFTLDAPDVVDINVRALWEEGEDARSVRITVVVDNTELVHKDAVLRPLEVSKGAVWKKAFSPLVPVVTKDGLPVSRTLKIPVPVLLGEHVFEVRVEGGPVLVSARKWRPRPRLREVFSGTTGAESMLASARRSVVSSSAAKAYLQSLAAGLAGEWDPVHDRIDQKLPPLLQLWSLAVAARASNPPVKHRAAVALRIRDLLSALPDDTDTDAAAMLVIELAKALDRWGQADAVRGLLDYAEGLSSPLAVATIMALGSEEARPGRRARVLAAALSAWSQWPLDGGVRELALRVWNERTAWSQLKAQGVGDAGDLPMAHRQWWLRSNEKQDQDDSSFRLLRLGLGRPRSIAVPAHPISPQRPARLRLFLYKKRQTAGETVRFRVDKDIWQIPLPENSELVDFALPHGERKVELVSGDGVGAFIAIPRRDRDGRARPLGARVGGPSSFAHVRAGHRTRYQIPDPGLPGPLLFKVRVPAERGSKPVTLHLRTDRGKRRELVLTPGSLDPEYMPQGGQPYLSAPASMVLWLDDDTRSIEIESPVSAWLSVSVRRAKAPDVEAKPAIPSKRLFGQPSALELARHDRMQWEEFLSRGDEEPASIARHLASISGPGFWPHQGDNPWSRPLVISPDPVVVNNAFVEAGKGQHAFAELRQCQEKADTLCLATALSRLHGETGVWQLGMGAIAALRRAEARGPEIERTLFATALDVAEKASLATGWRGLIELGRTVKASRITEWERAAGVLRVWSPKPALERGPRAVFLDRLAPANWGASTERLLPHGRSETLKVQLEAATTLRLQMLCRPLHGTEKESCPLRWRVDTRDWQGLKLGPEQTHDGDVVELEPGEHTFSVELDPMEAPAVVALRLLDGTQPFPALQKRRFELARQEAPAQTVVEGPGAIWLEARSVRDASSLVVALGAPAGAIHKQEYPLVPGNDQRARINSPKSGITKIGNATFLVLPLPESGPYTFTAQPDQGEAAIRAYSLAEKTEKTQRRAVATPDRESVIERPPWAQPQLQLPPGLRTPPKRGGLGTTLSFSSIVGQDDRGNRGDDDDDLQNRWELRTTWRHMVLRNRLWVGAKLGMRVLSTATSYHVDADTYVKELPGNLRVFGHARVYAQDHVGQLAWRLASRLRVDRSFSLTPNSFGMVAVTGRASHYSLNVEDVDMSSAPDPRVFTSFGDVHSRGLSIEWGQYWTPFLEQMGWGLLRVTSNEDLRTVDRFEAMAGWRGVAEWGTTTGPEYRVIYKPSLRIADANRRENIVRHDVLLRIDWTLWTGRTGRFVLSFADDLYLSGQVDNRNSFRFGVRFDWSGERSLSDWMPPERDFEDIVGRRLWADYH